MAQIKVLNIGSINMDLCVYLDKMPEGGQTCFGQSYAYIPGGKGANQGVAAARLGAAVTFVGRCGRDALGAQMTENFRREGMDVAHLSVDETEPTGLALIPVEANGQNRIIVVSGANQTLKPAHLDAAFATPHDVVMTGLEVPMETVYAAYQKAKASGTPFVLDCGPAMQFDLAPLQGIDVISPNETECLAMTGIAPDDEAACLLASQKIFAACGAKHVVLKLGGRGAYWYHAGVGVLVPAVAGVSVVDTTAAGDCFTAALAVRWCETGDMESAIAYANRAAAICISRAGAQPSLPYKEEVL